MPFAFLSFLLVAFDGDNDFWNRCIFPSTFIQYQAPLERKVGCVPHAPNICRSHGCKDELIVSTGKTFKL